MMMFKFDEFVIDEFNLTINLKIYQNLIYYMILDFCMFYCSHMHSTNYCKYRVIRKLRLNIKTDLSTL